MPKPNDRIVDKRVVERNLDKGLISKAELERHLTGLPDLASQAEWMGYEGEGAQDDDLEA